MEIDIGLIADINDLVKNRYEKKRFGKYAQAVTKLIPWLYESIDQSNDKKIRIRLRDIVREMGPEFEKKSNSAIYWGIKFVLFNEGIIVDTGSSQKDEYMLVMRRRKEEDQLPSSLKKYIEEPISDVKMSEFKIYDIFN